VAGARPDILAREDPPTMRLLCTCIALFTLACQSPPAAPASDAKPAPAKPADKPADKPVTPAHPSAGDSASAHGNPQLAPAARAPVNPSEVKPSGQVRAETIEGITASVPSEWTRKPGSNAMRLAEFTLPGPGGEVTLVVSRFAGGGGDAASNVNRWRTQFSKPDGSPVDEPSVKTDVRGALTVTIVDIVGTNVAAVTPGSPERYHEPDSRLLGVILEGAGDPYFFKAVGPSKTLDVWEPAFRAFAGTLAAG
jgi:hypothetical protein